MAERTLEPLITECPSCRTRFRVSEAQLSMAQGRVRCGACLSVFTATDNLVIGLAPKAPAKAAPSELDALLDELAKQTAKQRSAERAVPSSGRARDAQRQPPPPSSDAPPAPAPARAHEAADAEIATTPTEAGQPATPNVALAPAEDSRDDEAATPLEREVDAPPEAETDAKAELESVIEAQLATTTEDTEPDVAIEEIVIDAPVGASDVPETAASRSTRDQRAAVRAEARLPNFELPLEPSLLEPAQKKRRWWLVPATLLAAAALAAQVLWFQFDTWSRDLRFRPIYQFLCPYLDCKLPVMRAIASIRSRNLVVRSHPEVPNALVVDALLVNEAPFPQPFPLVELRFSSMSGALVAGRRFQPAEYLAGELAGATMMKPNTPIHIAFEIEDPGTDAVNYVMVFR